MTTLLLHLSRMSENVGAPTSCNPKGLHGLYRDTFTFTLWVGMVWICLAEDRDEGQDMMKMAMNLQVSEKCENVMTILMIISFTRKCM
jgi:hypothetical protein